jgi:hypothetical protein
MAMRETEHPNQPQEAPGLFFPSEEEVGETKRHLKLRTLLYQVLELAFADRAAVGSDQFIYWDATDPKACVSPDAFVCLGQPDSLFNSWKVWERGTPEVAIEVISASDERDRDWQAKLTRYRNLGVTELVRFDPNGDEQPLRIWDRVGSNLVARASVGFSTPSRCLPGHWVVRDVPDLGLALRLSRDEAGTDLYFTPAEKHTERMRELEALLRQR